MLFTSKGKRHRTKQSYNIDNMSLMRAVAQLGQPSSVSVIDIPVPTLVDSTDAIVKINASAICGSDLHSYRRGVGSEESPFFYGHEAIGHVVEVGDAIQHLNVGDYVVVPSVVDDGRFSIDHLVPSGYGGLKNETLGGLQAEYARVPFADNSLIPVPINSSTDTKTLYNYLLLSDIFPTGWSSLAFSGFVPGDTVAVFGVGPVGLLAVYSAFLRGASAVYAVDHVQDRLDMAESLGAVAIDFRNSSPVEQILLREPNGVDRAVECVGSEAINATGQIDVTSLMNNLINVTTPFGGISIMGGFTGGEGNFDIGKAFTKGLSTVGGLSLPLERASQLLPLIAAGSVNPSFVVSSTIDIEQASEYYRRFDKHEETKVIIRFP
ncbi:hypothetical protein FSARC_6786 [Fusarium sarcochroum]|uniref:Alcohol dehydrogenase n=1 Tax=Fusarium sarcochroum TaxID=1208366 RepID=A0A8H4TWR4_9HYPO|nr:hypothetical protein FSARC_6786 [Fusarium sarcochroum]